MYKRQAYNVVLNNGGKVQSADIAGITGDAIITVKNTSFSSYDLKTVSYTHLDVYKRQVLTVSVAIPQNTLNLLLGKTLRMLVLTLLKSGEQTTLKMCIRDSCYNRDIRIFKSCCVVVCVVNCEDVR